MFSIREEAKRKLPAFVREWLLILREYLSSPPLEDVVLHDYRVSFELGRQHRLSLVIPSIAPDKAFGGVTTGIELFLEIGKRTGADLRIILDDLEPFQDTSIVEKRAEALDLQPRHIEIVRRTEKHPVIR